MELKICENKYYRVKKGQSIKEIAAAFLLPPRVLAAENGLEQEAEEGQILFIPKIARNLYEVRAGDSKRLLCGSEENFKERNKTACFYPTQTIYL